MLSRSVVLTIGVLFHLIYLRSIFDIYFKSPIVPVEQQFSASNELPPAERLFLIVGDGLRADKLFDNPDLAPFLHEKVRNEGRWGISHTRVPTESRPGHVAMIAGLYEDVSAVTTGWTLNPVNFDSVFNQSRQTYSWGSPDILPMFREGATNKDRINCSMYDPEAEDFTEESDKLDTWVFEHVNELFFEASINETLSRQLKEPKTAFFLHLLGLDSAGHAKRPFSPEYLNNIATVDKGIRDLTETLEKVWGPEELAKTAFLFTADHGMSDWGSHGDGHPDNTRTPYIAWGAGIKRPAPMDRSLPSKSLEQHGTRSENLGWTVEQKARIDVAQADLATLMSYLLGVPYPKNGVGSLPLELLSGDISEGSSALFQNARQINAQYKSKLQHKANQLHFSSLQEYAFSRDHESVGFELAKQENWIELQSLSECWIVESLDGMKYLQRYDWLFLQSIVTLGYIGWMLFALIFVLTAYVLPYTTESEAGTENETALSTKTSTDDEVKAKAVPDRDLNRHGLARTVFATLTMATVAFLLERSCPVSYYAYAAFPLFFWYRISTDLPALVPALNSYIAKADYSLRNIAAILSLAIFVLQSIVRAYSERWIISAMWILASISPLFYRASLNRSPKVAASWVMLCFAMSIFTSLPTVQVEDIRFVVLGGYIMGIVGLVYILTFGANFTMGAQVGLIALATIVTKESSRNIANKKGLPFGCQLLGWLVLVLSLVLPLGHRLERSSNERVGYQERLMTLFLTFAPTFVILSISYEGMFYLVFWALLFIWVQLESSISESLGHQDKLKEPVPDESSTRSQGHRGLQFSDARIALYFFFLIQAAFFGTGNIASVSSFSLDSVYRLIPVFNPFAMGLLLIYKLLVPFAVISANLGVLNRRLRVAPSALFMTVLTFGDILTLNFFWMVRDEGSWLEIGSSISAFVIGGMLILFVICLEKVSDVMVGDVMI